MMMKRILCLIAAFLFVLPVASAAYKDQINRDEHVLQSTDIALGGLMVGTTRAQVEAETRRILAAAGRTGVILGADCTVPPDIDWQRFEWVRTAAAEL